MALQIRGLQRGEIDGFLGCFQAAFGVDDQSLSIVRNSLVNDPYFQPERVRVGLIDGVIISHAVILHRAAYVGNATVSVAGITAVATHPYYQRRGIGAKVVQDALRMVKQRGYGMAMLTTRVPGFFLRLGFREVPKVDGFECPTSALSRLTLIDPCQIERLDYHQHWPAMAAIYHQYSQGRTGMQMRDMRAWETWPRRGTFPYGFSSQLDACGLMGVVKGQNVAYLAAHATPDQPHMTVSEFAHLRGHEYAALVLLQAAARQFLPHGATRTVLQTGGGVPVLRLLEERRIPIQVEVGPGLMVLFPSLDWLKAAGLRNADEAIEYLFRSPIPAMWQRDGY